MPESFTVVRTRLPLALVLNYGGLSLFPSIHTESPSTFIRAHAAVSEPRKSTTKVAVPPSYTGLAWKYGPWVHYDGNSRLAICARTAERIESAPLFSGEISSECAALRPIPCSSHEMIGCERSEFLLLI